MKRFILTVTAAGCIWVTANAQSAIEKGKAVYETNCLVCHQADGSGVPSLNPPVIKTSFVAGDKSELIGIVLKGLSDTEIDGYDFSNPMPALDYLSDEDIANVLTYVRHSFTNSYSAVTPDEVKKARAKSSK